jgi:hypothetical protein
MNRCRTSQAVAQRRLASTTKSSFDIFVPPPVGRFTPLEIEMPIVWNFLKICFPDVENPPPAPTTL